MKRMIYLISTLFLTSCFYYEETLVLNNDSSGTLEIDVEFGKLISMLSQFDSKHEFEFDTKKDLKLPKGMELISVEDDYRKGRRFINMKFSFEDINDVSHVNIKNNKAKFEFDSFFHEIEFDGTRYHRVIELEKAKKKEDELPKFLKNMIDLSFTFHLKLEDTEQKTWTYSFDRIAGNKNIVMTAEVD